MHERRTELDAPGRPHAAPDVRAAARRVVSLFGRACAGLCVLATTASAQQATSSVALPASPARVERTAYQAGFGFDRREVFRIGLDYVLDTSDTARRVTVILGDATIDGHVDEDVLVVLGSARLSGTASISGSLIVIGGNVTAEGSATVQRDVLVVGGGFDAPPEFQRGDSHVVIGSRVLGGRLEGLLPWVTRGLLWGRPIVPDLPWVWFVVAVVFAVYLAISLIADGTVRASAAALASRPVSAFFAGVLVLVLIGPVCVLLALSIVGIAIIPFVIAGLLVLAILGRVAVARWIGLRIVRLEGEGAAQAVAVFAAGFATITLAYMIPVLGFLAWTMLGVFGLGAAMLAILARYREENPPRPRPMKSAPPALPVLSPPPIQEEPAVSIPEAHAAPDLSSPALSSVDVPPVAASLSSFPHAPFRERLAAFVLDIILVLIVQEVFDLALRDNAFFPLLLAYHIAFWTWKGTTIGGIICQLRVVRVDAEPLRFVDALVRGLSSIFSLAVLGLGALWILKDPERQAWHDKIAGTYVVKVPRHYPL